MPGQPVSSTSVKDAMVQESLEFLDTAIKQGPTTPFAVQLWDGTRWHHGDQTPRFTLELKHPGALRRMFWRPSELSLGEAFIFEDFEVHGELESCFELAEYLIARRWRVSEKMHLFRRLMRLPGNTQAAVERSGARLRGWSHSRERDAQAVQYHYNVSNDFYRLWLDERMVYSCALFHGEGDTLDQAQHRKLDHLCRKLRLKPGERLLDIGCGWGGLILHAAKKYGVEAVGITLSQPQADLANERVQDAGLDDRCRAEVCDYRDVPEDRPYDKIVSVGMFEHVGEEKLPDYFRKAYRLLKPQGVFLNHGITESMANPPNEGPSFIDRYVFPDGELLPISTSLRVAEEAGFEVRDLENLREHYAMTLRRWVKRLENQRDKAIALASPVTYRVWRIYMAGSTYGFETGRLGLHQSLLVKSGRGASGLPLTRCDWYRPCPDGRH